MDDNNSSIKRSKEEEKQEEEKAEQDKHSVKDSDRKEGSEKIIFIQNAISYQIIRPWINSWRSR